MTATFSASSRAPSRAFPLARRKKQSDEDRHSRRRRLGNGAGGRAFAHPKRNFMRLAAARKHDRQRRSQASAAENGDLPHSASFFLPKEKRGSVPSTRR